MKKQQKKRTPKVKKELIIISGGIKVNFFDLPEESRLKLMGEIPAVKEMAKSFRTRKKK